MPILDRRRSRRFSVVEIQKPTQPLATNDSSRPSCILVTTIDQAIAQPLMIPLVMVVDHVLGDRPSQVSFSQRHHSLPAFTLD